MNLPKVTLPDLGFVSLVALLALAVTDALAVATNVEGAHVPLSMASVALCVVAAFYVGRRQGRRTAGPPGDLRKHIAVQHVMVRSLWEVVERYDLRSEANTECGQYGIHVESGNADDGYEVEVDAVAFEAALDNMAAEAGLTDEQSDG